MTTPIWLTILNVGVVVIKVEQIWRCKANKNYYRIVEFKGNIAMLRLIKGYSTQKSIEKTPEGLAAEYELTLNCIECKTARIRHFSPNQLSWGLMCLSCWGMGDG